MGFKLNSIKNIKQVIKCYICHSTTEGIIQEPHGSVIKLSAGKLFMQFFGLYDIAVIGITESHINFVQK